MHIIPFSGELDLSRTLLGGQSFRWRADGNGFRGTASRHTARVERRGQFLYVDGDGDAGFWRRYFALDEDYPAMQARLRADPTLAACVDFAPGIRVLRQEFFEALICFIISACNNIPRITGIVERLCALCGDRLEDGYAFPTPERLASMQASGLEPIRAGFRAKYLPAAAEMVVSGAVTEERLRALPYDEAKRLLCTLPGVGGKVADCVLLFSLGFRGAIPRDVHILRAMERLFPEGLPACAEGNEGIAQQYIFEYARCAGTQLACPWPVRTPEGDSPVTLAPAGSLGCYRFVVIFAREGEKWLYARKKGRTGWETAGGHIEPGETPVEAARRELREDTGAEEFELRPAFDYRVRKPEECSDGMVFRADVRRRGPLPSGFEMEEVVRLDTIPGEMTYPDILPVLYAAIKDLEDGGAVE